MGEFLSPQQNSVTAASCTKSNQTEFVQLVTGTKLRCRDKDFHKNSPVHRKPCEAATCHTACCSNLSPSVFQLLQ